MRIKLQGGPAKNTVVEVPDHTFDYNIQAIKPESYDRDVYLDPPKYHTTRRGSYHRSNETLKNGTRVFKWMGWIS